MRLRGIRLLVVRFDFVPCRERHCSGNKKRERDCEQAARHKPAIIAGRE